jgi:hypothetical protein
VDTPRPDLSARQRATPPADRWHLRRGLSAGGYDTTHPMTLAPGMENDLPRYPGTVYDGGVDRERQPYYHVETKSNVGDGWVNWTAAGPPRAELHMRTTEYRRESGYGSRRFPFIPSSPTGGMHTMTPTSTAYTMPRYVSGQIPQMTAARINRLAAARYAGQSYSQSTAVQGRAVRR